MFFFEERLRLEDCSAFAGAKAGFGTGVKVAGASSGTGVAGSSARMALVRSDGTIIWSFLVLDGTFHLIRGMNSIEARTKRPNFFRSDAIRRVVSRPHALP